MDCSPPGFSVNEDSPGRNTGAGCHGLLPRIFLTQASNLGLLPCGQIPGLLHCRRIIYHLSHKGSPRIREVGRLSFLQRIFPTQESNQGLPHWRRIIYQAELPGKPILCYAKSLQSCPTLCDPMDGSPPGSAIPGILQARILEWVAISFSNA